MPMDCRMIAISPAVICSPDETTASYSRGSYCGQASRVQADELVCVPGHRGHDDGHAVAGIHLALHMQRGITDTFDIGDGRSAKLHDEEHLS